MQLRSGIPLIKELDQLCGDQLYREHQQFNADFLARHAEAMKKYGRHWGLDPFKLWSRRWEYPYTAQKLLDRFAAPDPEITVLDAGSGVTYFPWFAISKRPNTRFVCVDYDPSYQAMFDEINEKKPRPPRVTFLKAALQSMPLEASSIDAVCCISVLEHTSNYGEIVDEFYRVLKPGGIFVLTFDLSLDGKFTLPRDQAAELLLKISSRFEYPDGFDPSRELSRMTEDGILTTDYIRRTEPSLLPWSFPVRIYKALQDITHGRGWTGGFRSRTIYCLEARKA